MATNPNDLIHADRRYFVDDKGRMIEASGLTKREYFAAMAMQGHLAWSPGNNTGNGPLENMAGYWVECADALIVELNKEPSK